MEDGRKLLGAQPLLGAQKPVEIISAEQPLSEAEKELVREAYSRLQVWRDGCREMHDRAKEARRIALQKDPGQDPENTPKLEKTMQLPTLRSTLSNMVADQMDNMPEAMMLPETEEMQDVADDLTDVVRFVLDQANYEELHRRRVEDCIITGTAVTQVYWDEDADNGHGNVGLLRWPLEAFLWDPVAEDIQDARALIKVSWHPLSWYAAHYPDEAPYVGAETYAEESVGVPDAWTKQQPGDEDRAMLLEYWYRRYDAKTRRYTVNVAYIAGGALLERSESVYAHGKYPFVLDVYERIEGLPVGQGMVHEFADMMRYINRYYHYFDRNMRAASKMRLLVSKTAGIDQDALTDYSKEIIPGTDITEESVRWFQPSPFSGAANQVALQLQTDIKQDSGQNNMARGEWGGGITAASAIAALQEAGSKITRLRTATFNDGFQTIAELIIWLIAEFYGDKRVRMVTGRDGRPRGVDMSAAHLFGKRARGGMLPQRGGLPQRGALPPPPYSVQVQVSRRNPMRVQAQNELFLQAYAMAAQADANFPLTVLFELLTVDGKDRIMPVLREAEAQAAQAGEEGDQQQQEALASREEALDRLSQVIQSQEGEMRS